MLGASRGNWLAQRQGAACAKRFLCGTHLCAAAAALAWALFLACALALGIAEGAAYAEGDSFTSSASAPASASSAASAAPATPDASSVAEPSSASAASSSASSTKKGEPVVASDPFEDAVPVNSDDGLYLVDVKLEGGSGRASIASPCELEVFDGRSVVKLVWSSPHYDYMLVGGKKYLPVNTTGNSTFIVPVLVYDKSFTVVGDTTAMSEPYEVEYRLTVALDSVQAFDAAKLPAQEESSSSSSEQATGASAAETGLSWPWVVFIVCAALSAVIIGVAIGILRGYRNR